jgi:transposase
VLIAECGLEMSVFPTAEYLVSWAAVCPGLNASGGRRRSGTTRHSNRWLRKTLTEARPHRHSVEHRTRRHVKQLEALGHTVTLEAAP